MPVEQLSAEALAAAVARLDQHTHLTPYEADLTAVTDHIDALVSRLVLAESERDEARGAAMEKHGGLTIVGDVRRDVMEMWAQDKAALSSLKREVLAVIESGGTREKRDDADCVHGRPLIEDCVACYDGCLLAALGFQEHSGISREDSE